MAFIPFPQCIDAFMQFTGPDDEPCGFALTFKCGSVVGSDDLNDLGAYLASWFDTDLQPLMTAGFVLDRIKLRDLTTESSYVTDWVGILPLTGTRAGNSMPSSVAWALKKQTGLAGKSFRGRLYWMGMSEADVSGNYVDAVYAADVEEAWNDMLAGLEGVGNSFQLVVPSRQAAGVPRTVGVATPVTGIVSTDLRIDTQRRRLPED